MVSPEDFFGKKCDNAIDIAILDVFYTLRNCDLLSARELTSELQYHYHCKKGHIFTLPPDKIQICPICHEKIFPLLNLEQTSAERTVRNHLANLSEVGDIQNIMRDLTGEPGRAPEVYCLSEFCQTQLNEYLNKKEAKCGYRMDCILE